MGKFEGKIATNWPSEREKIKKGLKIDIEWLCPHAFIYEWLAGWLERFIRIFLLICNSAQLWSFTLFNILLGN